jgi:hypothetical protein
MDYTSLKVSFGLVSLPIRADEPIICLIVTCLMATPFVPNEKKNYSAIARASSSR